MKKIVFEFRGGTLDGQRIEGGISRSLSTVQHDPVLRHWFASRCGTLGQKFQSDAGRNVIADHDMYEVKARIDHDECVVVQVQAVPGVSE